jgi:DNA-binding protein H-NS
MTTYRTVQAQIAKLEKQAADLYKKEVATVVAKIQALMAEYNITPADLSGKGKVVKASKAVKVVATTGKKKSSTKPAGIPKYADPASGKTWTGHGKAPAWIAAGLKKGKKKEDFLIGKAAPAGKPVAKKVVKPVKLIKAAKSVKPVKVVAVKKTKVVVKAAKPVAAVKANVAKKVVAKAPAAKKPVAKKAPVAAKPANAPVVKTPPKKAVVKAAAVKAPAKSPAPAVVAATV